MCITPRTDRRKPTLLHAKLGYPRGYPRYVGRSSHLNSTNLYIKSGHLKMVFQVLSGTILITWPPVFEGRNYGSCLRSGQVFDYVGSIQNLKDLKETIQSPSKELAKPNDSNQWLQVPDAPTLLPFKRGGCRCNFQAPLGNFVFPKMLIVPQQHVIKIWVNKS